MSTLYDVGLQAGKKVAEAVDAFIAKENEAGNCFEPEIKKVLPDNGSTLYFWNMKWDPGYEDVRRFVKTLAGFDGCAKDDISSAYKLLCTDECGDRYEYYNLAGDELFQELLIPSGVTFPLEFYDFQENIRSLKSLVDVLTSNAEPSDEELGHDEDMIAVYDELHNLKQVLEKAGF